MKFVFQILVILTTLIACSRIVLILALESTPQVQVLEVSKENTNVLYRQKVMTTIGALMKGLGSVLKKECVLDNRAVAQSAQGIAFMTELARTAFKPKTEGATIKQTTKPEVWSEWDKFQVSLEEMSQAATGVALSATEKNDRDLKTSIGNLSRTCKFCHDIFRTK